MKKIILSDLYKFAFLPKTFKTDLVLVVSRINDVYIGHTCLTLDMAYNNARLLTKPEAEWLAR